MARRPRSGGGTSDVRIEKPLKQIRATGPIAGALTLLLLFASSTTASAATPEPDLGDTIQAAQDAVGIADSGVSIEATADGLVSVGGASAVEAPQTADDPITVGGSTGELEVMLPTEFAGERAEVTESGDVVYGVSRDSSVGVVEATADGVRLSTVINDASAPTSYAYGFGAGVSPVVLADGSAILHDGGNVIVGVVATPWAVDANGASVPTHFTVDGTALVQVVDHVGAAYPVVADPSVSLGWKVYVKYSKSEVKAQVTGWRGTVNDKAKYQAAFCAAALAGGVWGAVAMAACGLYVYDSLDSIMTTFKAASAAGKCVEMQYLYNGMPVGWKSYSC